MYGQSYCNYFPVSEEMYGIPTAQALISDIWIGSKGYASPKKIVINDSKTEKIVLIRNMDAALLILFTTRRP